MMLCFLLNCKIFKQLSRLESFLEYGERIVNSLARSLCVSLDSKSQSGNKKKQNISQICKNSSVQPITSRVSVSEEWFPSHNQVL